MYPETLTQNSTCTERRELDRGEIRRCCVANVVGRNNDLTPSERLRRPALGSGDGRASTLRVTAAGRRLYARINANLIGQQRALLQNLDPEVRSAVTRVITGLARAADSRNDC
jgi:hypothetical protein